jgi:amino-acid N-acetyltransferase
MSSLPNTKSPEGSTPTLRPAVVADVEAIQRLINHFAAKNQILPRGPQYIYENLRDFVVAVESEGGKSRLVGCGSLHVLWADQAEVRAMVIDPEYQGRQLGRKILEQLIDEARELGIKKVYAFTLSEGFFGKMGFVLKQKDELPAKLWSECSHCPKFFCCDEIGLVLDLDAE